MICTTCTKARIYMLLKEWYCLLSLFNVVQCHWWHLLVILHFSDTPGCCSFPTSILQWILVWQVVVFLNWWIAPFSPLAILFVPFPSPISPFPFLIPCPFLFPFPPHLDNLFCLKTLGATLIIDPFLDATANVANVSSPNRIPYCNCIHW